MRTASGFRVACLTIALALLGAGCSELQRDSHGNGVRGGTLLVLSADPHYTLDTAVFPYPAIARAHARTRTPPARPASIARGVQGRSGAST